MPAWADFGLFFAFLILANNTMDTIFTALAVNYDIFVEEDGYLIIFSRLGSKLLLIAWLFNKKSLFLPL
jgi:hypothetical protein